MTYKLAIPTSLVDDDAVKLLEDIDVAMTDGTLHPKTRAFVICDDGTGIPFLQREFDNYREKDFQARLEKVKGLKHAGRNITVTSSNKYHVNHGKDWREMHDKQLAEILSGISPDSTLNVGYMLLQNPLVYETFPIKNLHPAIPKVGPAGFYVDVMEEQAERVILDIGRKTGFTYDNYQKYYDNAIEDPNNQCGAMIHRVTGVPDRGPVDAYCSFAMQGDTFRNLFYEILTELQEKKPDNKEEAKANMRQCEKWRELAGPYGLIREYEFPCETPLIIFTYGHFTYGEWQNRGNTLFVNENDMWIPLPDGYNMNKSIASWSSERDIPSLLD